MTFPPPPTPLSAERKAAYRKVLYWATIDIRYLCQSRGRASWNPLAWRRQYRRSRLAGAIADWLHNLAYFAAHDFEGFSEPWFWRECDWFDRRWGQAEPGWWEVLMSRRRIEAIRAADQEDPVDPGAG